MARASPPPLGAFFPFACGLVPALAAGGFFGVGAAAPRFFPVVTSAGSRPVDFTFASGFAFFLARGLPLLTGFAAMVKSPGSESAPGRIEIVTSVLEELLSPTVEFLQQAHALKLAFSPRDETSILRDAIRRMAQDPAYRLGRVADRRDALARVLGEAAADLD